MFFLNAFFFAFILAFCYYVKLADIKGLNTESAKNIREIPQPLQFDPFLSSSSLLNKNKKKTAQKYFG